MSLQQDCPFLHFTASDNLCPHPGSFSLQEKESTADTTTNQNSELRSPVLMQTSTKQPPDLRLGEHGKGVWKDCLSQRNREFAVRLYLLIMSEIVLKQPHQPGCQNMRPRKTAINVLEWRRKRAQGLKPTQRTMGK